MNGICKRALMLILFFAPLYVLTAQERIVNIKQTEPLENQLRYENTKYVVRGNIDLQGKNITLPNRSKLVIKRGVVSNGAIGGKNSLITLRKKCLDNMTIMDGVKSTSRTVKACVYKTNGMNILNSLCNLCPENGEVVLDKKRTYTISSTVAVKSAITIRGNNSTIKLKNPDNCAITAFDVRGQKSFSMQSLTIDGSWNPNRGHGKYTDQYLMNINGVDNVTIESCMFKDAMVVITSWQERPDAMILITDYKNVLFDRNRIENCHVTEGLAVRNDSDNGGMATITNNIFDYVFTSSCVNAFYGKYIVKNNVFSTSRGSSLNIFGHDCEIVGNTFMGSQYSCAIDMSENGLIDYPSRNYTIARNTAYFCYDGFLNGAGIENVTISGNTYDCTVFKQPNLMDEYDKLTVKPKRGRTEDKILVLNGNLKNIEIKNNTFRGGQALVFLEDDAAREDIKIINNRIELDEATTRSAIVFNSVNGLQIKNNVFVGAGCTPGYLKKPVYIATLPVRELNRGISNVSIEGNQFISKTDSCYVFTQSVYDRNMDINFLEMSNITVENNSSNVPASLVFVNKTFSMIARPGIKVKNNDFKGGSVMANTSVETDMVEVNKARLQTRSAREKSGDYKMNTIVEIGGKRYYVVAGGKATDNMFIKKKDYMRNGVVVLREIK